MKAYSINEQRFLIKHKEIKTSENFNCPHCNKSELTAVKEATEPEFTGDLKDFGYEPSLTFLELTMCVCGKDYIFRNGC
jgi:hypothetical protein